MRASVLLLSLAALAAVPLVAGDTCVPSCDVTTAAMRFFVPAASVVQAGSTLSWLSTDNAPHTATDIETFCFHTSFGTTLEGSVLFFIQDGALFAANEGGEPEACSTPALPGGGYALDYLCLLHPEMKGTILVVQ